MTSFLKSFFGSGNTTDSSGSMRQSPSFNDFSLAAASHAEEEMARDSSDSSDIPTAPVAASPGTQKSVWGEVFNPGRNYNRKAHDSSYFDNVSNSPKAPTTWQYIIKAENLKRFNEFDQNADGFIDADELRAKLGPSANVAALIKEADKDGDGKINLQEFQAILRNV